MIRLRRLGLVLLLAATALTAGCFCCRPWGWHGHRCCYASPVAADSVPVTTSGRPTP
jgi:hypothetical protein